MFSTPHPLLVVIHCEDALPDQRRLWLAYIDYLSAADTSQTAVMRDRLRQEVRKQTSKMLTFEVEGRRFHVPPAGEMYFTDASAINWIDMGEGAGG